MVTAVWILNHLWIYVRLFLFFPNVSINEQDEWGISVW